MIISIGLQNCQSLTEPISKNRNITNLEKSNQADSRLIKNIAYSLALFLNNKENRKMLKNEINNSNKVEHILEASEFLNKKRIINSKVTSLRTKLASFLQESNRASFNESIKNLKFGLFDIYFPLEKWRKDWKSKDKLLIAAVGYRKNDDKSDILAYDSNGNKVYLSYAETPKIPTLAIYPSEKKGHYNKHKPNILPNLPPPGWEPPPPTPVDYFQFICEKLMIEKDYDPGWFSGNMEIYFKISHRTIGGNWSGWQDVTIDDNLPAGTWHNVWKLLYESTNSNEEIRFEIWEDDDWGTGNDDFVADATWNYWRRTDGVLLGTNISALPWTYTETYVVDDAGSNDHDYVYLYGEKITR